MGAATRALLIQSASGGVERAYFATRGSSNEKVLPWPASVTALTHAPMRLDEALGHEEAETDALGGPLGARRLSLEAMTSAAFEKTLA